jgi:SAM-dependent methyltransferase
MTKSQIKETPYDIELRAEGFHWWFVVRGRVLKFLLNSIEFPRDGWALDIGCSIGSTLGILTATGIHAVGLDLSAYAISLAKRRVNLPLINGDLKQLPIRSNSVSLIVVMDVLEHLENDLGGIHELHRVLKDRGALILTVPAFKSLWGLQDVLTGHYRRYSLKELSTKLREGGFDILRSSYFNFLLFFPILLGRRLIRLLGLKLRSENELNFPLLNFFLKTIFSIETRILKYFSFPFGVSILCVTRKR